MKLFENCTRTHERVSTESPLNMSRFEQKLVLHCFQKNEHDIG